VTPSEGNARLGVPLSRVPYLEERRRRTNLVSAGQRGSGKSVEQSWLKIISTLGIDQSVVPATERRKAARACFSSSLRFSGLMNSLLFGL
jgi:hypothetical protein